ncbi:MAG TPA: ABC transporter permease [Pirellulaceae bacterium]|nr:ABC transporter permease [Pirellulaceae bacterium]
MHDLTLTGLIICYLLLIFPLAIILWLRVPILKSLGLALLRMTVQLLLVGFYLRFLFSLDHPAVNLAWLLIMILVADASVLSGSGLRLRRLGGGLFLAMAVGTLLPVLVFTGGILRLPRLLEAQYLIPIAGMVLGNCLRADIVGLRAFYGAMHKNRNACRQALACGATLNEMIRPWYRDALDAALAPTIATMATVGLVSLPGMMTGVILAGADPFTAIKYQLAIMIAIFTGTALTVFLAIRFTLPLAFDPYGNLHETIFTSPTPASPARP